MNEVLAQRRRLMAEARSAGARKSRSSSCRPIPTGPLHVGHGRGAAYGASLANVLDAAGFDVAREYYVNDAGRQMDILALSTWLRYLELAGETVRVPAECLPGRLRARRWRAALRDDRGERLRADRPPSSSRACPTRRPIPKAHLDALIARAKALLGRDYEDIHAYALDEQLADCREDLTEFGVVFDTWFSERSLYDSGRVARRDRAPRPKPGTSTRRTARSGFARPRSATRRTAWSSARMGSTPTSPPTSPTT